jgi:hypothetical protein
MRASVLAIIAVVAIVAVQSVQADDAVHWRYVGYAYDRESGALIYTETHHERLNAGNLEQLDTEYRNASGDLIAARVADFRTDALRPQFSLRDGAGAVLEAARRDTRDVRVMYREDDAGLRTARLSGNDVDVVDAGFLRLIEQRWDELLAGEAVRFEFLVPSRLEAISMRVRLRDRDAVLGVPAVTFLLELANPLLRWLTDPIEVSLHAERRELLRYVGVSNMRRPGQSNYEVRIEYPPQERQALRTPLRKGLAGSL